MTGYMNPAEFANIARSERDFWWYRGMRRIFFSALDPFLKGRKLHRVLESGCGTGFFSHLLQTERRWPVIPMDISGDGLRYAQAMGVERPVQGNMTALPFRTDCFELLISIDALVHLPPAEAEQALREMCRVLEPGGLVVIRTAALETLRSRHSAFVQERQRYTRGRLSRRMPPSSGVEPGPPWLERLLHSVLTLEASWIHAGGSFPLGQSLIFIGEKAS